MRGSEVKWHLVGASFDIRKHHTRRRFTSDPGTRASCTSRKESLSRLVREKGRSILSWILGCVAFLQRNLGLTDRS